MKKMTFGDQKTTPKVRLLGIQERPLVQIWCPFKVDQGLLTFLKICYFRKTTFEKTPILSFLLLNAYYGAFPNSMQIHS